ncbi:stage V sporulation protein D [Clostridium perfringens]|uniref:stage V sporulation protein D n=1 Tax=Clostridium perfringens TaxID=1502 RepID=UPI0030CF0313
MKRSYRDMAIIRKRLSFILAFIIIMCFILSIRLSYVMIIKGPDYADLAVEQWTNEVKISARRGKILDRDLNELAISSNVYRIDLNLNAIRSYTKKTGKTNEELALEISKVLEMDKDTVLKKIEFKLPSGAPAGAAILARRIEKEKADKVKELEIPGVMVSPDTQRYYPNDNFLSHVLGTTNSDGVGLNGIELKYDRVLSGSPGLKITEMVKDGAEYPYTISRFTAPVDGKDVVLTIDEKLQYFAEQIAEIGLVHHNADAASVIIMNPNNGEILAMSNKPDFNPNKPYDGAENFSGNTSSDRIQKMWRNRSVSDSFEPGSIFKIITASAAVQEGVAGKDETYTCSGGLQKGDRFIKCWKRGGHGTQTFEEIIQNSCNVGFMNLGEKLGAEKLNEYIKKFGLGKKSGVDLPGESPGIVKKTENITDMDLATISFGQTNTVNPIQFMTAVNAVANGGTLIQPHVVKEISYIDENNDRVIDETFVPKKTENLISKETADQIKLALENAVKNGSAKGAYKEGYGVAGKTGTAQKVNPETGGYGGGYVASFVGFAPYDNPQISVMVSVDNPKNGEYYGGRVAAPLAGMLLQNIFNYIDLTEFHLDEKLPEKETVIIPEVRGLPINDATSMLKELGISYEIEGEGEFIVESNPAPGYPISPDTKITLIAGDSSNLNSDVIIPDFKNYSKESAEKLLNQLGLIGEFVGEGPSVTKQSISPDEVVNGNSKIKLTLGY